MEIYEFQGLTFTPIRGLDGRIVRMAPVNPATISNSNISYDSDSEAESSDSTEPETTEAHYVLYDEAYAQSYDNFADMFEAQPVEPLERPEMLSRATQEIDEPVVEPETVNPTPEKAESVISSVGSESFDVSDQFPALPSNEKSKPYSSSEIIEIPLVDVCYKPTYRTLKKLQMRSGPGAKFAPVAVIPAEEQVRLLADGLAECSPEMFLRWWSLHITFIAPSRKAVLNRGSNWEMWVNSLGYSSRQVESIMNQIRAANRKVKVAVSVDGEEKFGWVSKRKNSGPMMIRTFGLGLPIVQVDSLGIAFSDEVRKFREENKRKMPRRSFYSTLLKKAAGCDTVRWEARWVADRKLGMELKTLSDGRVRTGYYQPDSTAFLVFSSLQKAKAFIQTAGEKLGNNVEAYLEADFANLAPAPASECPFERFLFDQEMSASGNETKAKREAGIFSISAL